MSGESTANFDTHSIDSETSLRTVDGDALAHVKNIDDVLADLGFGRFQSLLLIAIVFIFVTYTYQILLMYFIGDSPSWKCKYSNSTNTTDFCLKNINATFKISDGDIYEKRCTLSLSRDQWEYTEEKTYSIITEYDLVCDKKIEAAFPDLAFFLGWAIGGLVTGILADTFGRKIMLNVTLILFVVFTISSSFIGSVWQLCILRALNGVNNGTCVTVTFIYLTEFTSNKHRSMCVNVTRGFAAVSLCALTLAAYFCRRWRYLNTYMCIPIVLGFCVSLFLPKSPRWLLAHGKREEAEEVLRRLSRINKKNLKFTLEITADLGRQYSYRDLLCGSCKVTTMVFAQVCLWFTGGLITYALSLESAHIGGDKYVNFVLSSIIVVPGNIIGTFLCNRSRKRSILISLLTTAVISGLTALTFINRDNEVLEKLRIALAVLGKMSITVCFSGLYIWTPELFSTVVRSQGMTICQMASRIGSAVFPLAYVQFIGKYEWIVFVVMFFVAFISTVFGLVLPETRNKPTRERYEDMLDNDTVQEIDDPAKPLLQD